MCLVEALVCYYTSVTIINMVAAIYTSRLFHVTHHIKQRSLLDLTI
jgi:hypothetical protein